MPNYQNFMVDFEFDHIRQNFANLLAKNMKGGSDKSKILFVGVME